MKKILISLFVANIAVLAFVFIISPKETKAGVPAKIWDPIWVPCGFSDDDISYANYCFPGWFYPICNNGPCGVTILE